MFAVTVQFEINSESLQFFMPLMHANARRSLEDEPGCQQFDICTDPSRPTAVFLYEIYDNAAAFAAHLQQPHFKSFDAETAAMITSKSIQTFEQVLR